MNNGPSWQSVQGCGAHLKKQQITGLQGHQGGAGARLERWGEGLPTDTQERRVMEGAPHRVLGPETSRQSSTFKGQRPLSPSPGLPPISLVACLLRPRKG